MENINYHDFLNMCRTCMLNIDLKPIEDKTIIDILELITDKNYKTDDELPQQICGACIKKILDLSNFIKQCKISENNFKTCLANFKNECASATIDSGKKSVEVYVIEPPEIKQEKPDEEPEPQTNENVNFDSIIIDMRKEFDVLPTDDPLNLVDVNLAEPSEKTDETVELNSGDDDDLNSEGPTNETYKCEVCDRSLATQSSLKRHMQIHSREGPFKCDVCDKVFNGSSNLLNHQRSHVEKKFECDVCKKTFKEGGNYARHQRTHSGVKPYKCSVCKKQFSHSSNLVKHKRIHTGLKPYKCGVCFKEFRTSSHLAAHKNVHGDEHSYKCDVCGKFYKSQSHLKRHLKTHLEEKRYTCDLCDKKFQSSSNLAKHKKTQHKKNEQTQK